MLLATLSLSQVFRALNGRFSLITIVIIATDSDLILALLSQGRGRLFLIWFLFNHIDRAIDPMTRL